MLLLDEPLGALDLKLRENMQEELKTLQKSLGITFVFVTHDQGEALSMADRVAVFNDGRIMQVGAPRGDLPAPEHRASSPISSAPPTSCRPISSQRYAGQRRWASLRPEAIRIGRDAQGDGVPARSFRAAILGATTRLALDADGAAAPCDRARRPRPCPAEGERWCSPVSREDLHLMDERGMSGAVTCQRTAAGGDPARPGRRHAARCRTCSGGGRNCCCS